VLRGCALNHGTTTDPIFPSREVAEQKIIEMFEEWMSDIGIFITSMLGGEKTRLIQDAPPFWTLGNNADPFPHFMG